MSDREKIEEGELAVRLTSDIEGGLGKHEKGAVIRNLSFSAFNTLTTVGGHQPLEAGTAVSSDKVADPAPPAPTGTKNDK